MRLLMRQIRKSNQRGVGEHGWLHAKHTFSFSEYYDSNFMGFRQLRVINEDKVESGQGFPMHSHKNMEIVTYIISGKLEHKDSLGNGSVIIPGEVQLMSAGKGIQHSEFNHSKTELVHLLQIWIEPNVKDLEPSYEQKNFPTLNEKFTLVVSPNGERNSLKIKQNAKIYRGILKQNERVSYKVTKERHAWIQVAKGKLNVDDNIFLEQGDGLAFSDGEIIDFSTKDFEGEFLLFDLP